jgi:hypothetical protein
MQFGDKIMKNNMKKLMCLMLATIFLISTNVFASKTTNNLVQDDNEVSKVNEYLFENYNVQTTSSEQGDIDPLVDLAVTVTIKDIRALDKIDWVGNPNFYVKILINGVEHTSPIWRNQNYVKPNWSVTQDVPDESEFVNITIQLWDKNVGVSKICDISPISEEGGYMNDYDVGLMYSLKSGHWTGDDYNYPTSPNMFDPSGYGRLNGCDDNSIYQNDRDCELWFDITQNDYDGDGIPYWTEVNVFHTDPTVDNRGWDNDSDGVPIEWEFKWGHYFSFDWHHGTVENKWIYDPFVWEDHRHIDLDNDGLTNYEEYLTSQWDSDPFRKDLFIELDQMEESPRGEKSLLTEGSKNLLRDAYDRHNIAYHLDDGSWKDSGSDMIPFDESTDFNELGNIYQTYFLHGNQNNWRRGVFHYGLLIYNSSFFRGFAFSGDGNGTNCFQISSKGVNLVLPFPNIQVMRDIGFASVYMHETGHTLGIFNAGVDNKLTVFPYRLWLKFLNYRSCMNYAYTYVLVDYSDGSRGKYDFDDWGNLDLTFFEGGFF